MHDYMVGRAAGELKPNMVRRWYSSLYLRCLSPSPMVTFEYF